MLSNGHRRASIRGELNLALKMLENRNQTIRAKNKTIQRLKARIMREVNRYNRLDRGSSADATVRHIELSRWLASHPGSVA